MHFQRKYIETLDKNIGLCYTIEDKGRRYGIVKKYYSQENPCKAYKGYTFFLPAILAGSKKRRFATYSFSDTRHILVACNITKQRG